MFFLCLGGCLFIWKEARQHHVCNTLRCCFLIKNIWNNNLTVNPRNNQQLLLKDKNKCIKCFKKSGLNVVYPSSKLLFITYWKTYCFWHQHQINEAKYLQTIPSQHFILPSGSSLPLSGLSLLLPGRRRGTEICGRGDHQSPAGTLRPEPSCSPPLSCCSGTAASSGCSCETKNKHIQVIIISAWGYNWWICR